MVIATSFFQLCIMRLCSYWVPRYIFAKKFPESTVEERGCYEVAMHYLQGSLERSIEVVHSKENILLFKYFQYLIRLFFIIQYIV